MLSRRLFFSTKDPYWMRLSSFSLVLFFVFLADSFLSFWVPNFLQETLGDSFKMGLVMSFSSFIGFGADIIFPQILKNASVKRLLISAIIVSFFFVLALSAGISWPHLLVFLAAMALWGIYYEYLYFAQQQFVAVSGKPNQRTSSWGIIAVFKNLAYFLGPLLAGYLLIKGDFVFLAAVIGVLLIAFLVFAFGAKFHEHQITVSPAKVNILSEIGHWKILFASVWPVVILSLTFGLIDSMFWTTGAVWTETASRQNFWGGLILPAYQLPSLFIGLMIAKANINTGKKKMAERFLALAGIALLALVFDLPNFAYVIIIFFASCFMAIAHPLVDAIYTDIVSRMGVERKHLIGLSASTGSLAYIIGPVVAGLIASYTGERGAFVAFGLLTFIISAILLLVTPKKLRLPASDISAWRD